MTELSDASASTIAEAQTVLERFLPRFNARFRVPAAEPEVAYRPLDRALPLASILGFRHPRSVARDNTVKYRWRMGMTTPFGPTLMSTVSDFVRLTVQRKCPFGWSLMVDDAAPWHPGGPPARTYLLMVLREMPSSRAVARIESPCRRAC